MTTVTVRPIARSSTHQISSSFHIPRTFPEYWHNFTSSGKTQHTIKTYIWWLVEYVADINLLFLFVLVLAPDGGVDSVDTAFDGLRLSPSQGRCLLHHNILFQLPALWWMAMTLKFKCECFKKLILMIVGGCGSVAFTLCRKHMNIVIASMCEFFKAILDFSHIDYELFTDILITTPDNTAQ